MELELLKKVIDFVLDNLDIDSVAELRTRLTIAYAAIEKLHPWDLKEVLPLIFGIDPAQEQEAEADAE